MPTTTKEPGASKRAKKDKPNGKADAATNGVADEKVLPFPEPAGTEAAADGDEPGPDAYTAPEPTQKDLDLAGDVFSQLVDGSREMGAQSVIDSLISIVDVHGQLRTPENLFASSAADEEKYELAPNLNEIVRILVRGCPKLEVNPGLVVCYFKDHEKWTSAGQKVHGKVKRFDGFLQHHLEGMKAALIINYHLFATFNPRQKIFTLYRLLREIDDQGKRRAPDYVGYFEEPGLFGAGVHEEHAKIARAFVKDAAAHVGAVHQLSLMAGIFDED